jgi:hypothetical protein
MSIVLIIYVTIDNGRNAKIIFFKYKKRISLAAIGINRQGGLKTRTFLCKKHTKTKIINKINKIYIKKKYKKKA